MKTGTSVSLVGCISRVSAEQTKKQNILLISGVMFFPVQGLDMILEECKSCYVLLHSMYLPLNKECSIEYEYLK